MTLDEELQLLRLEKRAAVLVAENLRLRKRCEDLQRMHKADQNHIGKLQAQLKRQPTELAEQVFKDG